MGSQLQLCTTVGSQLIEKCTKFWSPLVWPLQPLLMQNQDTWDMGMDMGWEVSALEEVSTPLGQSMSPGPPRVLVRGALTLSLVITHRTTGLPLLLPMDTPHAMGVVASAALSQDILVWDMDMDMVSEVSAEVLVFTQPDLFMSPDLPRVLVSAVLTLSLVITHRTTGLPLSLPMDTPHAMVVVVSAVLSQDILVWDMDMDMVSEVSA